MSSEVKFRGKGSGKLSAIKDSLDKRRPVVAYVRRAGRSNCHHFVLVTGYRGQGTKRADFEMIDPITGRTASLATYAAVCSTRVIY